MLSNHSKLSSEYLNKFLNLDTKSEKKVLSSQKVRLKKKKIIAKQNDLLFSCFCNKLFSPNEKVLDFKILQFLILAIRPINFKNSQFLWNKRLVFLLNSINILMESSFTLLLLLNSNFHLNGNRFFKSKAHFSSFLIFFKQRLLSTLCYNGKGASFRYFYFKFFTKYILFTLYFQFKIYRTLKSEKYVGSSAFSGSSSRKQSILTSADNSEYSDEFYSEFVYKKKRSNISNNCHFKNSLSHVICRKQLRKKKKILDDKNFNLITTTIRNFLKIKNVKIPDTNEFIRKSIRNITPLYKITYQRRGRNKVAVAKYLFNNKIRESIAIKWLLGSTKTTYSKYNLKRNCLEQKIITSLIDSFLCKGDSFNKSKLSRSFNTNTGRIFNKGYLVKTTKSLLSKK